MRLRHTVLVQASEDTDGKDLLIKTDTGLAETVVDDLEKAFAGIIKTLASATDTLSFGDIAVVLGLFIKVNGDCTVTINGHAHAVKLRANAKWAKLFLEETITSLTVTAPAEADVRGTYAVWGDVLA